MNWLFFEEGKRKMFCKHHYKKLVLIGGIILCLVLGIVGMLLVSGEEVGELISAVFVGIACILLDKIFEHHKKEKDI